MNLVDLAIIAMLALFVLSGVHKGFMYTAISVLSMVVCMMLAFLIMPLVSGRVVANEKIFNSMLYYTEGSEYIYDVEFSKMPITAIDREDLEEIYNRSDVAYPMDLRIHENIQDAAFEDDGIIMLGDYFNQTMVLVTINILVFLLIYAALRVVSAFVLGWRNYAKRLPKLKKLDLPAAIGTGLIRGLLAMFILFMLCPIVLTVLPFDVVEELVEDSALASFFYRSNFLLGLIPGV
ncbi:MAG: hypothetical protein J6P98_00175 [Clostridia bacterium]|nr:hypothetical protein [Clostridia bacterium]